MQAKQGKERIFGMSKFLRTLLIGVGVGLLIAPKRGEETRRLLTERFQQVRKTLSGNTAQGSFSSSPASGNSSREAQQLKRVAEVAEQKNMMNMPPTASYEPAFPEYVNPETRPNP